MNLDDVKNIINIQKTIFMRRLLTDDEDFNERFKAYCIGVFETFQLSKGIYPPKDLLSKHTDSEVNELDTFIFKCCVELSREHTHKEVSNRIFQNIEKELSL